MELSRQEYWHGLPFLTPGGLSDSEIKPKSLCLLHWQAGSLQLSHLPALTSLCTVNASNLPATHVCMCMHAKLLQLCLTL